MKKKSLGILFIVFIHLCLLNGNETIGNLIESKKPQKQIDILLDLAEENMSNDPDFTIEIAEKMIEISISNELPIGVSDGYTYLGIANKNLGNYKKALEYQKKALEIRTKEKQTKLVAITLNNIGIVYDHIRDSENAIASYEESIKLSREVGDSLQVAKSLNNLGICYRNLGQYQKALKYFIMGLAIDEKLGIGDVSSSYDNIAIVNFYLRDFEKALQFFEKSLSIRLLSNDKKAIASSYNNLGIVYKKKGNLKKALEFYQKSLQIKNQIDDVRGQAATYTNIGQIYIRLDNPQKALPMFEKSLEIKRELGNPDLLLSTLTNIGETYVKLGKADLADKYLEEALQIAEGSKDNNTIIGVYENTAEAYEIAGNLDKALQLYKKYVTLRDSLFTLELSNKTAELQVEYETEKKQRRIETLSKEKEFQKIIRNYLIVIVLLVGFGFIILYRLYQAKNREILRRKKVEKEIRDLNQNLEKRVQQELEARENQRMLLTQKSKLEALGRLSAGIAHEVNQPIARLSLGLDNILVRQEMNRLEESYLKEKCNLLFNDIERIKKIIDHIRIFSRDQREVEISYFSANEVIKNACMLLSTQYKNHHVYLELTLQNDLPKIMGNKFRLEQVIMNLLSNAKDAVEEKYEANPDTKKQITVKTSSDTNWLIIEVIDCGVGMKKESIDKIFDPFYTTKDPSKGTGLGLSISYGIIQDMHGHFEVESKENEYSIMRILLPIQYGEVL